MKKYLKITALLIVMLLYFSAATAAYFQPEVYRRSLLEIRDAERNLRQAEQNLKSARNEFKIIDNKEIKEKNTELESLYQKMIRAYQENNDQELSSLAAEIISLSQKIKMQSIESKPVQLRAFWLDSGTFAKAENRAGLAELLERAEKANFNLIFPEIFYKGLTVIPDNELFKQDPRFNSWEEDPLKILIEEAEKRKIEVHAWVWVFNENTFGQPGRILEMNPEWANKNKAGEIITYHNSSWLSPAREDVKEYLKERYKYLVGNYNLDGINLDYIRFPEEYRGSFGYDSASVERFKKEYGIDPFKIENGSSQAADWNKYREKLINEMVKETSELLRKVDPNLLISADVIPGINEARYRALQNWSFWLEKDYLDFVVPMTYTENLFSELSSWIEKDRDQIDKPLYAGISVFKLTPAQVIKQVEEINKINANGLSLFAAAHLTDEDFESLAAGVFKTEAVLPHQNKEKSLQVMQDLILKRLNIIKEAEEIDNYSLISIRAYLNQILADQNYQNLEFKEFVEAEKLEISQKAEKALESDFRYLKDILRLY